MKKLLASMYKFVRASRERHVAEVLRRIDKGGALSSRGIRNI